MTSELARIVYQVAAAAELTVLLLELGGVRRPPRRRRTPPAAGVLMLEFELGGVHQVAAELRRRLSPGVERGELCRDDPSNVERHRTGAEDGEWRAG